MYLLVTDQFTNESIGGKCIGTTTGHLPHIFARVEGVVVACTLVMGSVGPPTGPVHLHSIRTGVIGRAQVSPVYHRQ